jgi:hypothetical protein
MSKTLFLRIVAAIESHDDYFHQKPDARGVLGAPPIQKAFGAFRMLAYGVCGFLGRLHQTGREHNHRILEAFC